MNYSKDEIKQYVTEEDIKFIRLAFCDLSGRQKNISIHPDELARAFTYGIAFDAKSFRGFSECSSRSVNNGYGRGERSRNLGFIGRND